MCIYTYIYIYIYAKAIAGKSCLGAKQPQPSSQRRSRGSLPHRWRQEEPQGRRFASAASAVKPPCETRATQLSQHCLAPVYSGPRTGPRAKLISLYYIILHDIILSYLILYYVIQDSSKRGAVETGCSDLYDVIY